MKKIVDIRHRMPRHRTKQVTRRQLNAIRFWVLHHSLTTSGSPEAFANFHINTNNWSIMAYHYVIMRDGTIYWCADHDIQTPHVGNSNRHSLGVCMVGDFRTQVPTKEQYEAAVWLFNEHLPKVLPVKGEVKGHSEMPGYSWKACPVIGMNQFRDDLIRVLTSNEADPLPYEEVYFNMKLTKVELSSVISALEDWTDETKHRNPLDKNWLEKARKGELTIRNAVRLQYEARRRGLK